MEQVRLGTTKLQVSRLCFGSLTMGPLQKGLGLKEAHALVEQALSMGINFFDTAEIYDNYKMLIPAVRAGAHIASKSYASSQEAMDKSVAQALRSLGTDHISLFLLHEQESRLTLKGHYAALMHLVRMKERGYVGAVGVSTHYREVVAAVSLMPEVDVVHPICNMKGLGIRDDTLAGMLEAMKQAYDAGKGIYIMKALGGGHLRGQFVEALSFARDIPFAHSCAVGISSVEELLADVAVFEHRAIPESVLLSLKSQPKSIHVEEWCNGCGNCALACPQQAISMVDGKARVTEEDCVFCGYCVRECEGFFIKVY
ncbi:MAG: aldo/keto reductase [Bacillota bacterium]